MPWPSLDPLLEPSHYITSLTSLLLLLSTDGRASSRDRFCALVHGEISVLLSWIMAHRKGTTARRARADQAERMNFDQVAAACRVKGDAMMAA